MTLLALALAFEWAAPAARAASFATPVPITDSTRAHQLSRCASTVADVDGSGTLHLTYWAGGAVTNLVTPSFVYYRSWTKTGGWSGEAVLDSGSVIGPNHVGGRHPSLAVLPDGRVWVVWQDHRHGTAPGNFIDNTEIYGAVKPAGAAFPPGDVRLTSSTAVHAGDNSYAPRVVTGPANRVHLGWYDYNANATVGDIYLHSWDADASTGTILAEPLSASRATNETERGGTPDFTLPDLAVDSSGTRHMAWTGGTLAAVNLYYGESPAGSTTASVTQVPGCLTDYFDPPHIVVLANGDAWISWGDDTVAGQEEVRLVRKPAGAPLESPITLVPDAARQFAPDMAVDSQGLIHLAWVDLRGGRHIRYGLFDPTTQALEEELVVTTTPDTYERPTVVLEANDRPHVIFERRISSTSGEVWHAAPAQSAATRGDWTLYE